MRSGRGLVRGHLQPVVVERNGTSDIAQGHVGAGQWLAVQAADDARKRPGLAELEVMGDILRVTGEPEKLARLVAVGLDQDRLAAVVVASRA